MEWKPVSWVLATREKQNQIFSNRREIKNNAILIDIFINIPLMYAYVYKMTNDHLSSMKIRITHTCNGGKDWPTTKLADQLTSVATLTAADRGPWENNSATIIQGMEPVNTRRLRRSVKAEKLNICIIVPSQGLPCSLSLHTIFSRQASLTRQAFLVTDHY